jgi:uncharacterized protein (DUF1697 family)
MTRQVALLRGINVGGRNMVAMAQLRDLVGSLGYTGVRTHLQSGNVVFASGAGPDDAAAAIAAEITERLGLRLRLVVRTRDELAAAVAGDPFAAEATDPARLIVLFLSATPDPELLRGIDPAAYGPERMGVCGREIHVWCPNGVHGSPLLQVLSERRLGVTVTARNWRTVIRLLAMASE